MVRIATRNDVEAIKLIAMLSWKQAYEELLPQEIQEKFLSEHYNSESIANRIEQSEMIVVTEEGLDVGFAEYGFDEDSVHVYAIYVLPSHQRQGFGKKMIDHIEKTYPNKPLVMDLENGNFMGETFCSKLGFEKMSAKADSLYGYPLKKIILERKKKETT